MSIALLLIPDFLLILFGFLLNRITNWGRDFWAGLEKLIYYVLFPALLFNSIASQKFDFVAAAPALKTALITVVVGMLAALCAKWLIKAELKAFASSFQTAFRFNAYIGLAIAGRLHGEAGIAAMGIIIGVAVPLCNIAAVWMLARGTKVNVLKELIQNPLILATVGGVAYSLSGMPLPEVLQMLISRMGAASLACGLLTVGAALTFNNAVVNAPLITYNTAVKLLIMPITAIVLARYFSLHIESRVYYDMVILFSAVPTAASAYVLAIRMGGNGAIVAQSITVSTLLGMLSIPLWLTVAHMI
jgi:malonate transporter and related proteins